MNEDQETELYEANPYDGTDQDGGAHDEVDTLDPDHEDAWSDEDYDAEFDYWEDLDDDLDDAGDLDPAGGNDDDFGSYSLDD